jgi:hypothetical protein
MDSKYNGISNGIYGCVYQKVNLAELIKPLGRAFPCINWPSFGSSTCFFVNAKGFGLRKEATFSALGTSLTALFILDNSKVSFSISASAWIFKLEGSIEVDFEGKVSPKLSLSCGSKSCMKKIVDMIGKDVTKMLEGWAKSTFKLGEAAEETASLQKYSEADLEHMLQVNDNEDLTFWKKKKKKNDFFGKLGKDIKKTSENVGKGIKDAVKTVENSFGEPKFSVSDVIFTGSGLCDMEIAFHVEIGAKVLGKTYRSKTKIRIGWNPEKNMGDSIKKALPNPFK